MTGCEIWGFSTMTFDENQFYTESCATWTQQLWLLKQNVKEQVNCRNHKSACWYISTTLAENFHAALLQMDLQRSNSDSEWCSETCNNKNMTIHTDLIIKQSQRLENVRRVDFRIDNGATKEIFQQIIAFTANYKLLEITNGHQVTVL